MTNSGLTTDVSAIGISYPASLSYQALELKQCENCPDMFVRTLGSAIKFCGHCIADHLMHPVPWCRGSLSAYVRGGEDAEEKGNRAHHRFAKAASKACRQSQHFSCCSKTCPCSCHPQNAQ